MSALRDRAKALAKAAVRSEVVEAGGEKWLVKGLMSGDVLRIGQAENLGGRERSVPLTVALGVHDPEDGKPVWNANDAGHQQEIRDLPFPLLEKLVEAVERNSDLRDAEGNGASEETKSSPSSLPVPSEGEPSPS